MSNQPLNLSEEDKKTYLGSNLFHMRCTWSIWVQMFHEMHLKKTYLDSNIFHMRCTQYMSTAAENLLPEYATCYNSASDPFSNWALKHAAIMAYPTPSTTQVVLTLSSLILDFNLTCLFCPFNFTILLYNFRFEWICMLD